MWRPTERDRPLLKRHKLQTLLKKITDKEFNGIWKGTYGYVPSGERADLARDFVAEQYDKELDGCIALAESFLTPTARPKPNPWLAPR
jgi:hypothetical protein